MGMPVEPESSGHSIHLDSVVTLENQFGKQQFYTGRACALLVPTEKMEAGSQFPVNLDHYKVYQVLQGEPVNREVALEDQLHR